MEKRQSTIVGFLGLHNISRCAGGFNGKMKDDRVYGEGNFYDYGFRIYNPRLGKFLSVDPLAKDYPWNATYAFAENDVIRAIDLEGAERRIKIHSPWFNTKITEAFTAGNIKEGLRLSNLALTVEAKTALLREKFGGNNTAASESFNLNQTATLQIEGIEGVIYSGLSAQSESGAIMDENARASAERAQEQAWADKAASDKMWSGVKKRGQLMQYGGDAASFVGDMTGNGQLALAGEVCSFEGAIGEAYADLKMGNTEDAVTTGITTVLGVGLSKVGRSLIKPLVKHSGVTGVAAKILDATPSRHVNVGMNSYKAIENDKKYENK